MLFSVRDQIKYPDCGILWLDYEKIHEYPILFLDQSNYKEILKRAIPSKFRGLEEISDYAELQLAQLFDPQSKSFIYFDNTILGDISDFPAIKYLCQNHIEISSFKGSKSLKARVRELTKQFYFRGIDGIKPLFPNITIAPQIPLIKYTFLRGEYGNKGFRVVANHIKMHIVRWKEFVDEYSLSNRGEVLMDLLQALVRHKPDYETLKIFVEEFCQYSSNSFDTNFSINTQMEAMIDARKGIGYFSEEELQSLSVDQLRNKVVNDEEKSRVATLMAEIKLFMNLIFLDDFESMVISYSKSQGFNTDVLNIEFAQCRKRLHAEIAQRKEVGFTVDYHELLAHILQSLNRRKDIVNYASLPFNYNPGYDTIPVQQGDFSHFGYTPADLTIIAKNRHFDIRSCSPVGLLLSEKLFKFRLLLNALPPSNTSLKKN